MPVKSIACLRPCAFADFAACHDPTRSGAMGAAQAAYHRRTTNGHPEERRREGTFSNWLSIGVSLLAPLKYVFAPRIRPLYRL